MRGQYGRVLYASRRGGPNGGRAEPRAKGQQWPCDRAIKGSRAQELKGSRAQGLNGLHGLQGPRATHNTAFSHALSSNLHTVQAFKAANHAPRMAAGLRMGEPSSLRGARLDPLRGRRMLCFCWIRLLLPNYSTAKVSGAPGDDRVGRVGKVVLGRASWQGLSSWLYSNKMEARRRGVWNVWL